MHGESSTKLIKALRAKEIKEFIDERTISNISERTLPDK
jgi:hypothetical protein